MARALNGRKITGQVVNVASVPPHSRFCYPGGPDRDTCDICGGPYAVIGCPNGKQICQHCFDGGYDGDQFYDDDDFHHFLGL